MLAARVCGDWESLSESDGERYAFVLTVRPDGTWTRVPDLARCSPAVVQFVQFAGAGGASHGTFTVTGGQCLATVTQASISAIKVGQIEQIALAPDGSSLMMGANSYQRVMPPPTPVTTLGSPTAAAAPRPVSWTRIASLLDDGSLVGGKQQHGALFKGVLAAADESLIVAAEGPDGDHVETVMLSVRLRAVDPAGAHARLSQACGLARELTGGNVESAEFGKWVANCLADAMVDPIERSGWVIKVRNFRQLGFVDVKSEHGTPVVIELRLARRTSTIP